MQKHSPINFILIIILDLFLSDQTKSKLLYLNLLNNSLRKHKRNDADIHSGGAGASKCLFMEI